MYEYIKDKKVVLFGAGQNGLNWLNDLMSVHIKPAYFVDNNINAPCLNYLDKCGKTHVFSIKPPGELAHENLSELMIIITPNLSLRDEIAAQLKEMGMQRCVCRAEDIFADNGGGNRFCPVCHSVITRFSPFSQRESAVCPICGALERHRALWLYLENNAKFLSDVSLANEKKILHFAPEKALYEKFSQIPGAEYYPVDIDPLKKGIRKVIDIQSIDYPDNMFDLIICNHVLEHIPDDRKAIRELRRVLRGGGAVYISVPIFDCDTTYDNPEYNTPELRLKHYGQADHVRKYGRDFASFLNGAGFSVSEVKMQDLYSVEELHRYGLSDGISVLFECRVRQYL